MLSKSEELCWNAALLTLIAFVVGGGLFAIVDACTASTLSLGSATVIEKSYQPAISSSGMGFSYTDKGVKPVFVDTSSSESFTLVLRRDGHSFSMKTSGDTYGAVEVGGAVELQTNIGGLSGWHLGCRISRVLSRNRE